MPQYTFKARARNDGEPLVSEVTAADLNEAADKLLRKGFIPSRIEIKRKTPVDSVVKAYYSLTSPPLEDMVIFTVQLATLFRAGVPMIHIFEELAGQEEEKRFKRALIKIRLRVEDGAPLNESMRDFPEYFSETYTNIVLSGETSGRLDEALDRLVYLMERDLETSNRVREVLRYPKIVSVSIISALAVLMTYVVPRFAKIFESARVALPTPTIILIEMNTLFQNYWEIALAVVIVGYLVLRRYIASGSGRKRYHHYLLKIPVTGKVLGKIKFGQFCGVLGSLLKSGIPVLRAIDLASSATGNDYLAGIFLEMKNSVRDGSGLAEPMRKHKGTVPPIVGRMVAAGEASGKLDDMLEKAADYFNRESEKDIKNLSSYLEPLMVLVLGLILLFVALAIFLPIWDLTKIVSV
jgi:type II secretory pathway component PulF